MTTKAEIDLPRDVIEGYKQARREFSKYYYKQTTQRMVRDRADESLLYLFERFHQAFENIVYAATAGDTTTKEDSIREALACFIDIISKCKGNVSHLSFSPTHEVRMPEDIVKFRELVGRADDLYYMVTGQRDSQRLPYFADVLDHLVNAASSSTSLESKIAFLANARGCLFGIAFSLFEETLLTLRSEIMQFSNSKFYRLLPFLWNNPSRSTRRSIILSTSKLDSALTYGYTHRSRIDMAEGYFYRMEADCKTTSGVRALIKRRSLRLWARSGKELLKQLLIAAIVILLLPVIASLIKWLMNHYPTLGF